MKLIRPPKTVVNIVFSNNVQVKLMTAYEYGEAKKFFRNAIVQKSLLDIDSLTDDKNSRLGSETTIIDFEQVYAVVITEVNNDIQIPREEKVIDAQGNVKDAITLEAPPSNGPQQ